MSGAPGSNHQAIDKLANLVSRAIEMVTTTDDDGDGDADGAKSDGFEKSRHQNSDGNLKRNVKEYFFRVLPRFAHLNGISMAP